MCSSPTPTFPTKRPMQWSGWCAARRRAALVLTSLMVKLRCESFAERLLIPAFVFFFDMLYPFAWVDDPRRRRPPPRRAAACSSAARRLSRAGGHRLDQRRPDRRLRARRGDEAAGPDLARPDRTSRQPPPLSELSRHPSHGGALGLCRAALFAACGSSARSPAWSLTYLAPPLLAIFGSGLAQVLGAAAWLMMAISFQPMLRLYRCSPLWGFALPAIAAIYTGFTLESAIQHWRGRGGAWKGRFQAAASAERIGG